MKKFIAVLFSLIPLVIFPFLTFAKEPENICLAEKKLTKYHDSGEYQKDIKLVADRAIAYVKKRVLQNKQSTHPKKLAAVFDIDETCLSNYPDLARMHFGGTDAQTAAAEDKATDKPIKAVLSLYQTLRKNNVAIFFITGRFTYQKPTTVKNLKSAGFKQWTGLYFRPPNYHKQSAIPYKSHVRKQIEKKGYDVILTIGDQMSDLKGGYADKGFKLPDPYYFIP